MILYTENIKKNNIGSVIEKVTPHWPEEGPREYHGLTRGWVANEVFRRLETQGRTIGEYLAEDVAKPLGADVFVGVPQDRLNDYAPVKNIGLGTVLMESMKTNTVGGAIDVGFFEFMTIMKVFRKMSKEGQSKPIFHPYQDYDEKRIDLLFNKDVIRRGESSSANGNCSARGECRLSCVFNDVLRPCLGCSSHGQWRVSSGSQGLFVSRDSKTLVLVLDPWCKSLQGTS